MKIQLVPHWRQLWRAASIQLGAVHAALVGLTVANLDTFMRILGSLPPKARPVAAGLAFIVYLFGPLLARAIQQEKLTEAKQNAQK